MGISRFPALLMKKRLLLAFVALILPSGLYASSGWFIGIESGYSYSIVDTATGWEGTTFSNGHGFDAAVIAEYMVNDNFSVAGGMRWIMKSSGYRKVNSEGMVIDDYTKMHHILEFPLTVRTSVDSGGFRFYLGAGGYLGVRLFDAYAGTSQILGFSGEGEGSDSYYGHSAIGGSSSVFDAGILAEAGAGYYFDGLGYLYAAFRFQYGLTSLEKDYKMAAHTYFDNLSFDLGFMFSI